VNWKQRALQQLAFRQLEAVQGSLRRLLAATDDQCTEEAARGAAGNVGARSAFYPCHPRYPRSNNTHSPTDPDEAFVAHGVGSRDTFTRQCIASASRVTVASVMFGSESSSSSRDRLLR